MIDTHASSFFRSFLRSPTGVGSVAPSSRALADAMLDLSELHDGVKLVELGAGTGPVTRALANAPVQMDWFCLEPNAHLAALCRMAVPEAEVVEAYAQDLPRLVADRGWESVDRLVSSLPFASWDRPLQEDVVSSLVEVLAPGGRLVTFTYALSPWLPRGRTARDVLREHFMVVETAHLVLWNLPPAFIYRCEQPRK